MTLLGLRHQSFWLATALEDASVEWLDMVEPPLGSVPRRDGEGVGRLRTA